MDWSGVEYLSGAALQALLALRIGLAREGGVVETTPPSEAVRRALELGGAEGLFTGTGDGPGKAKEEL